MMLLLIITSKNGMGYDKYDLWDSSRGILINNKDEWFLWETHDEFSRGNVLLSKLASNNSLVDRYFNRMPYVWRLYSPPKPMTFADALRHVANGIDIFGRGKFPRI